MSVKNFKFVSPGVFINEIDNSFVPKSADAIGPVVVGRSTRGLAMQPIKVDSYSKFVEMFGETVAGIGSADVYRNGNYQSPMYGTYAAKAFLRSNVAPLTYIRLLGQQTTAGKNAGGAAAAGWKTDDVIGSDSTSIGGAYGLWVCASGTTATLTGDTNGMQLAAIFYMNSGSISLQGSARSIGGAVSGSTNAPTTNVQGQGIIIGTDSNDLFTLVVTGSNKGARTIKFDFDDSSDKFVRKRVNTNPQLLAGAGTFYASASTEDLWLGESFELELRDRSMIGSTNGLQGVILGLALSSSTSTGPHDMESQASAEAKAGWFIAQDLSGAPAGFIPQKQQKLFRLLGRGHGEWLHKNVKVTISKIRQSNSTTSDYGTFSVLLRMAGDTDSNVVVLERYDNCTLDPASPNYVARQIGDKYTTWDETEQRLKTYGTYENRSKFVYVQMNEDVDQGASKPKYLPFGYFGPPKFTDLTSVSSSNPQNTAGTDVDPFILGAVQMPQIGSDIQAEGARALADVPASSDSFVLMQAAHPGAGVGGIIAIAATASLYFPKDRLRLSASDGSLSDRTNACWGWQTTRASGSTRHANGVNDAHRLWYSGFPDDPTGDSGGSLTALNAVAGVDSWSYVFSMDDVVKAGTPPVYFYSSGSRANEGSVTSASYESILNDGYGQFTAPFWGGFDGFNIQKPDPLYNNGMGSAVTEDTSYAYHTWKRAINTVSDPEAVNMNLLVAPGLTNNILTEHMITVCEDRGDVMALIDLPSVYIPPHEQYYSSKASRIGTTPTNAANSLRDRRIDSSYGATFYPWVQTRDERSGAMLWIPPTVAMLGVLGSSEAKSQVWFAPAGFNRGGLTDGAAGIPVTSVTERLTSKDRDILYEARINPIASFPSSGIVVFGQKTLQERQSALDRINVRRLVIYLKKQISILSTQVLFEQNVQATWTRFKGLIEPLLANTKVQFGITDYRLILDESTTTPDLIDQNIMYAKIMVKPARAIEFIAIDFVIASTGASFDD